MTVAALEPKFWARLCELLRRPDLLSRRADAHAELDAVFAARPLDDWLELFAGEDVCVGPVATFAEAAETFGGEPPRRPPPSPGEHTSACRRELGL